MKKCKPIFADEDSLANQIYICSGTWNDFQLKQKVRLEFFQLGSLVQVHRCFGQRKEVSDNFLFVRHYREFATGKIEKTTLY